MAAIKEDFLAAELSYSIYRLKAARLSFGVSAQRHWV